MATVKTIKVSLFGLMSAALMAAPAMAQNGASITQVSDQNAVQVGHGNTSIQGNMQTGVITQSGGYPGGYPVYPFGGTINGASVLQGNSQNATQIGVGNSSVQGNSAQAIVDQGGYLVYPYGSGINAANIGQVSNQGALQLGTGNTSVQGNAANANIFQQ